MRQGAVGFGGVRYGKARVMSNNTRLYQGLYIYRNAMVPFIVVQLQAQYGDEWWERGILPALRRKPRTARKDQLSAISLADMVLEDGIDTNFFRFIVRRNWSCFEPTWKRQAVLDVWFIELTEVRNAISHPNAVQVSDRDTTRAFDTMIRIVQPIDPDVVWRLEQAEQGTRFIELPPRAGERPPDYERKTPYAFERS